MDVRSQKFVFNGVTADFANETLRTSFGHTVALRPQAFAVLRFLAEHTGRLVGKDELMKAVWSDLAVTDDSLVQCIHEIRRAIRDNDRSMLKTAPKRGYTLVLPTEPAISTEDQQLYYSEHFEDDSGEGHARRPSAKDDQVTEPARVAIAVLPFVNMSSDSEQEYFSDGITEDVITDLSRWKTIAVASRNSSSRFKGQRVDIRAAGRKLGVHFLVEGSVRRLGERVRVTAQLVEVRTGNHIWAERYDSHLADLAAVQDEVVQKIVGTLVGRVYASATENLRRRPPSSPHAYDLTLRANWLAWDNRGTRAEAKDCLERAIDFDPEYGLAHSLLAFILFYDWHRGPARSLDILDRAFELAVRGVELANNDSTSHVALAHIYLQRRSFEQASSHMKRAMAINPANPALKANYGLLLSRIGCAEEGLECLRDAQRADPYFGPPWFWQALGITQFVLRRYAEAMTDFDRGTTRNADTSAIMAACCAKQGLFERAGVLMMECLTNEPEATLENLVGRTVFLQVGDSEHLAECLRFAGMPE